MNFLDLHNNDGGKATVNLERVYLMEPYKYGEAKLTRLYMSDYCYAVLETPDEIFDMNLGKCDVPHSVIQSRAELYKKQIKGKWYPYVGDKKCDT